jgi:hypothetical protein
MDIISKIIEKINDPLLLSFILITLSFVFMFKDHLSKGFDRVLKINKSLKKKKIATLLTHDVFPTLVRVRNEVGNMKFYTDQKFDRVKTRMCYDFTRHKVNQCSIVMRQILKKDDIDSMNRNALKSFVFFEQNKMHQRYISDIVDEWESRGVSKDDRDYVIRLFEKFRYDVVRSFENRINAIFSNENYNTNYKLMLAVFEMWAMGIDLLPRDMSTTFEALNGKFKNLKY